MKVSNITTQQEGCFTYIKVNESDGFSMYKVNTTDHKKALNLYNKGSRRVAFVGCLTWLDQ